MLQNPSIKNLCVVGGGFMGTQIALRAARHGFNVSLIEPNDDARAKAGQVHVELLDGLIASGFCNTQAKEATLARLQCTQKLAAVATADLVIEAVHEQLELKRQLFAELDRLCPEHTILATNSSSSTRHPSELRWLRTPSTSTGPETPPPPGAWPRTRAPTSPH